MISVDHVVIDPRLKDIFDLPVKVLEVFQSYLE